MCTLFSGAAPDKIKAIYVGERRLSAEARRGVVTQLLSLERHPELAFLLENPSNSDLWNLPEVMEILLRNPQ